MSVSAERLLLGDPAAGEGGVRPHRVLPVGRTRQRRTRTHRQQETLELGESAAAFLSETPIVSHS